MASVGEGYSVIENDKTVQTGEVSAGTGNC